MRIALFSDIHANLPALESFFADVETRNVDAMYCLGDLVGYNTWPNEVVQEIRRRQVPCITGNYDYGIGRGINDCGCAYKTDEEKSNGAVSIAYTNERIGESERGFLRTLPAQVNLQFQLNDDRINLLLVHGSPRRVNEYLFEDRDEKSLQRIMQDAGADVLCFGHTHKPYHRILPSQNGKVGFFRHAINVGSVGKPKDGNPHGSYAILTIHPATNAREAGSVGVEFIRFSYDVEKAAKAIEASILPDVYAAALRTGT